MKQSEWSVQDTISYYGSALSFLGTISLGVISVWQTNRANNLSEKLLKNALLETTTITQLQNKFNYEYRENKDKKITWSAHHKKDYGATIAIEPFDEKTKRFNQYLIEFYFKCSGKGSNIKEILINDLLFVQDASDEGLTWEDKSDDPIPLELKIEGKANAYLNWISEDKFYIQIKVYCEPNKCFDSMMKNDVDLCLMFNMIVVTFNEIESRIHYKLWLQKFQGINVIRTNTTFDKNNNECIIGL